MARNAQPSDVSDGEWVSMASPVTLMGVDARQQDHSLRKLLNSLRYTVREPC